MAPIAKRLVLGKAAAAQGDGLSFPQSVLTALRVQQREIPFHAQRTVLRYGDLHHAAILAAGRSGVALKPVQTG